ncbi:calcipressin-1-like [Brienomyrus brachyistius]|uniref:calcipressin-1-like n=1 Tax=Brienomyrus brachyistius TaxID=42636 RepID=UPI0020B3F2B3|nr:calcipressin-1-like [Brienomyrus brachyistius]
MHLKTTKQDNLCLVVSLEDQEVFSRPEVQAKFEELFRSFDSGVTFQFFKSFRHVRVAFSDALAAAEAKERLNKSLFNGKEMRLHFAQSVHIGSPRLELPKPLSSLPGWEEPQDTTPILNCDLFCDISKTDPGEGFELHSGTPTTPSVVVHICGGDEAEGGRQSHPKIIETRRPDYVPAVLH